MSEISSGLVAVAEVGAGFSLRWTEPDYGCSCKHYDKLVRLSDAEAIISDLQRKIALGIASRDAEIDEREQQIAKQAAALKLAKDAFSAINIEAKTFMSYENARNNFSDDTDERKAYEHAMVKASELTKQALAAIDEALKGE